MTRVDSIAHGSNSGMIEAVPVSGFAACYTRLMIAVMHRYHYATDAACVSHSSTLVLAVHRRELTIVLLIARVSMQELHIYGVTLMHEAYSQLMTVQTAVVEASVRNWTALANLELVRCSDAQTCTGSVSKILMYQERFADAETDMDPRW